MDLSYWRGVMREAMEQADLCRGCAPSFNTEAKEWDDVSIAAAVVIRRELRRQLEQLEGGEVRLKACGERKTGA